MEDSRAIVAGRTNPVVEADGAPSFESFFEAERDRLLRALRLLTGDRYDAEEIAQDSFFKVWQRWDKVGGMESPSGYLYRVALNRSRNRYRAAVRAAKRTIALPEPPDPALTVVAHDTFRRWLGDLTPRQRVAIVLTEFLAFDAADAAEMMQVKVGTLHVLVSQARAALREATADG
jgi:RNA polymerase sigma factor (sigma-70 family)